MFFIFFRFKIYELSIIFGILFFDFPLVKVEKQYFNKLCILVLNTLSKVAYKPKFTNSNIKLQTFNSLKKQKSLNQIFFRFF